MPKYKYIVVNKENKQLSGSIGAPDERSAREELSQLGFSIISINEVSAQESSPSNEEQPLTVFEFNAIDKNGKSVIGTIEAEEDFSAYKRLVNEYLFDVQYLINNNLSEADKEKAKKKGIFELQNRLDEEAFLVKKKTSNDQIEIQQFEQKQQFLQSQVDFVLKKVKEMLDLYEADIKPDTKEKIRKMVDKVLRIKNSTNLDYIRNSCEELLTFLQKEELFLHQDARVRERTQMALEAKNMMMQLHKTKGKASRSINEQLHQWREIHIINNDSPSFIEKLLNIPVTLLIGTEEESPEVKELQLKINLVGQQIKEYLILYFQSPSPEFKAESKESLKRLWAEKKKLKQQLKLLKGNLHAQKKHQVESTSWEKFWEEISSLIGWLLAFYLIYYFISLYAITKQIGFELPVSWSVFNTKLLKYFVTILFLIHGFLSVKMSFFRRNEVATLVMTPLFIIASLLVFANF